MERAITLRDAAISGPEYLGKMVKGIGVTGYFAPPSQSSRQSQYAPNDPPFTGAGTPGDGKFMSTGSACPRPSATAWLAGSGEVAHERGHRQRQKQKANREPDYEKRAGKPTPCDSRE